MGFELTFRNKFHADAIADATINAIINARLYPIYKKSDVFPYCYYNIKNTPNDTVTKDGFIFELTINSFVDTEKQDKPHEQLTKIHEAFWDKFHNKDFYIDANCWATYFRREFSDVFISDDGITLQGVQRYLIRFGG